MARALLPWLTLLLAACANDYDVNAWRDADAPADTDDGYVLPEEEVDTDVEPEPEPTCEADAVLRTFTFSAPETVGCAWGVGENLGPVNELNQARTVEHWEVPLPAGSTLCSVNLTSEEDALFFDDHITLTLDDAVLVGGGSGYAMDLLPVVDGIPRWDWSRVRGTPFAARDTPYTCLGGAEPCVVPATEQPGPLELSFDDAVLQDLLDPEVAHELWLYTFGDDNDTDCAHSAFTLRVDVEILE